jgi:hypothetical protein
LTWKVTFGGDKHLGLVIIQHHLYDFEATAIVIGDGVYSTAENMT